MKVLDLTLPTPSDNLALDEALLDAAETSGAGEVLRLWEPKEYFVVVGYANKVDVEVNRSVCEEMNIPVFRRCSGGGTVLQGPGCLNYTIILKIDRCPMLATVPQTNEFIMLRQSEAVQSVLQRMQADSPTAVSVRGHTDLALGELKFSGNAQRRKREFLLFHGTLLLNFDLNLIEVLLRMPSKQPDYRNNRPHRRFLTNTNIASQQMKLALQTVWHASEPMKAIPPIEKLVEEKYSRPDWNFKF